MWSHFILTLSLLATVIECRPEQNNKKLKAAIKENSDRILNSAELQAELDEYYDGYYDESEEKKVI